MKKFFKNRFNLRSIIAIITVVSVLMSVVCIGTFGSFADAIADVDGDYKYLEVTAKKGQTKGWGIAKTITNTDLGLEKGKSYVLSLSARGASVGGNLFADIYKSTTTSSANKISGVKINLNTTLADWTSISSDVLTVTDEFVEAKLSIWVNKTGATSDAVVYIDALTLEEYDTTTGAVKPNTKKTVDLSLLVGENNGSKVALIDNTPIEAGANTSADYNDDYMWLNVTVYGKGSGTDNKGGTASATLTNDLFALEEGKNYVFSLYAKGDRLPSGNIWFETYNSSNTATDKVQINLNGGAWGEWTKVDSVSGGAAYGNNYLTMDKSLKVALWAKNTTNTDVVVNIDAFAFAEYDVTTGAVVAGTEKLIKLSELIKTDGAYGKTELIDKTPIEAGKDTSADQSGDKKWLNVTAYGKGSGTDNIGGSASAAITNDVLGLQKGKAYVISLYAKGDKITNGNIWFETYDASNTVTDKVQINLNGGVWRDWTKVDAVGTTKFTDNVLTADQTVKAAIWVKNTTDSNAVVNIDTLVVSEYDTVAGAVKAGSEKAIDLSKLVKTDAAYGKTELIDKDPATPTPTPSTPTPTPTPVQAGADTSTDQNGDKTWVNVTVYGKGSGTDNKGGSVSATITNDLLGLQKGKYYTFSLYAKGDKLTNGNMWFETYDASNTATDKVEISLAGGAWGQWTKIDGKGTAKFTDNVLKMDETVKAAIWAKNTTDSDAVVNIDTLVYAECDAAGNVIAGTEKAINLSKLINLKAVYGKTELVDINPPPEAGKDTSADYDGDAQWLNVTAYGGKDNKGGLASSNVTNAVIGLKSGKAYVFSLYVKGDKLTSNGNIWFETYDADGNATDKVQINLIGGAWRDWTQLNSVSAGDKYPDNYLVMNKTLKSAIWVKNTTDSDVVINIDALAYAEYDVATGKIVEGTEKTIRLSNYVNLTTPAGKSEFVSSEPITYCRIDNVNFSKFTSVNNAVMKAKGYKNNTAMYFSIPEAGATANAGAKLENLYNGIYTVTAYVKSSGGFTSGHMYANNGMEYTASVKEASPEWTLLEIPYVEVTDGKLQIGFWLKGAKGGEYLWADHVQLKLHGKVNGPVEPYFTKVIDIKNTELSTNANTILASGGYKNATKLSITGTQDYKGNNGFTVKNLEEGTYTLTAYVRSSGGHTLTHMFANAGSDSSTQLTAVFSKWACEDWTQIELTGIKVTSKGQLLVGFWTNTKANKWLEIDYIQLKKEGYRRSPNTGESVPREAIAFVAFFAVLCVAAVNLNRRRTSC